MAELTLEQPHRNGDRIETGARFRSSGGNWKFRFIVEEEREPHLAVNADPFVIASVVLAMQVGEDVLIHGEVSPSLLANLEVFQQAWATWKPERYRQVELRATVEKEPSLPERNAAISGFTGGVDSCFTAYRHTRGVTTRFPLPLKAVVMVHGFDIPLDDTEGYTRASAKAERQVTGLGLDLFRVETDFRALPVVWPDTFGSAVASVLSLFSGGFHAGLIAGGVSFDSYKTIVEGSNPLTDPLLSSDSFRVICDGSGFRRVDKIAVLSDWSEGLKDLRVCARNPVRYENCCVCEKCIRNILSFRVLGLELPPCFDHDVTERQIRELRPLKEFTISIGYEPIIRIAEQRGVGRESWVRALRKTLRGNRRATRIAGTRILWRLPRFRRRIVELFRRWGR